MRMREGLLRVGDGYTDFVEPHRIKDLECLTHRDEFTRIVQIHESTSKLSSLHPISNLFLSGCTTVVLTLSKRFCQCDSISCPAASIHVSTALARSGRIERMLSSALGDF